jgi:hypothetical protein
MTISSIDTPQTVKDLTAAGFTDAQGGSPHIRAAAGAAGRSIRFGYES